MKEQRINLETAILAKQKGIEIILDFFHTKEYGLCEVFGDGEYLLLLDKQESIYDCNGEFFEDIIERFSAPTQNALSKYLRDNFNIHVIPVLNNLKNGIYNVEINLFVDDIESKIIFYNYDSFEKSLEAGIYEALKHI
jgi:hypothetical protein